MQRFFGLMPRSQVQIQRYFTDENGFKIGVQAGTSGWTIIWADASFQYKDIEDTAENNFRGACQVLQKYNINMDKNELPIIDWETDLYSDFECEEVQNSDISSLS